MRTASEEMLNEIDMLEDFTKKDANELELVKRIEELEKELETKSITLTNGSKYSYTEKAGDSMVSYGFDNFKELSDFIIAKRKFDKVRLGKQDPIIKE